jgi:hypothetical protein
MLYQVRLMLINFLNWSIIYEIKGEYAKMLECINSADWFGRRFLTDEDSVFLSIKTQLNYINDIVRILFFFFLNLRRLNLFSLRK